MQAKRKRMGRQALSLLLSMCMILSLLSPALAVGSTGTEVGSGLVTEVPEETPAPEATPEVSPEPSPEVTENPLPEETETPAPEETPLPEETETPVPEETPLPEPTEAPEEEYPVCEVCGESHPEGECPLAENYALSGSGTQSDPYVIDSATKFQEFATNISNGTNYSGKFIKQTESFTLPNSFTSGGTFAGTYDGGNYVITLQNITVPLFNTITGRVQNVHTAGSSKSKSIIVRNLDGSGMLLNCGNAASIDYNTADVKAYTYVGSMVQAMLGATSKVVNCYNTGTITANAQSQSDFTVCGLVGIVVDGTIYNSWNVGKITATGSATGVHAYRTLSAGSTSFNNCYSLSGCVNNNNDFNNPESGATSMTEANMKNSSFATTLNNNRSSTATAAGVSASDLKSWTAVSGGYPVLMSEQSAPTGLTGVAAVGSTSAYINGTTAAMEYKLSTASSYTACTAAQTNVSALGTYNVRYAETSSANASPTVSITIGKGAQSAVTVRLSSTSAVYGTTGLTATASGGDGTGTYSYVSGTPGVATINAATGAITIVGVGTTAITAKRAGDSSYNDSETSSGVTLTVTKAPQPVLTVNLVDTTIDNGTTTTASVTGGAGSGAVTYSSSDTGVATVSGTTIRAVGVGVTTITATKATDSNYNAATSAGVVLTVGSGSQSAPTAPAVSSQTDVSVVLASGSGYEYARGAAGGGAVDEATLNTTGSFEGLAAGTAYDFYRRLAAKTGYEASAWSPALRLVTKSTLGSVSTTGSAALGGTLTATVETAGASVSYAWERADALEGPFAAISGESALTYAVRDEDGDKYIRVTATASGDYYGTRSSAPVKIGSLRLDAVPTQSAYLDGELLDLSAVTFSYGGQTGLTVADLAGKGLKLTVKNGNQEAQEVTAGEVLRLRRGSTDEADGRQVVFTLNDPAGNLTSTQTVAVDVYRTMSLTITSFSYTTDYIENQPFDFTLPSSGFNVNIVYLYVPHSPSTIVQ